MLFGMKFCCGIKMQTSIMILVMMTLIHVFLFQVDNYEAQEFQFNIKASADAQFNNIQYMYIGRNESMTEGFIGCISRVEFDDIYPLKLLFQENGPANVRSLGERKLQSLQIC
jgi:hypothetical protein